MADRRFAPGTQISSTNKTDRHDITEILLKVTLITITPTSTLSGLASMIVSGHFYISNKVGKIIEI